MKINFRTQLIIFAVAFIMASFFMYRIMHRNNQLKITKIEQKQIKKSVDSLKTSQHNIIRSASEFSTKTAKKSINLIKNLPNEKTIINDTNYDAMCRYITIYKPRN